MRSRLVAIVGSGICGTAIARELTRAGHRVVVFEKGPEFPYPHNRQFADQIERQYDNPAYALPADLRGLTTSGSYRFPLDEERGMVVGGSATHWQAIALRMLPEDFRTRTLFGYGADWPIDYDEIESWYGRAERLIGVAGTDEDNPFAPARSTPYPLPPFELSHDDVILAGRLRDAGIVLHTTPQARTRHEYDGRPACANFGTCHVCPIGARYSPNHHLGEAVATGLCEVRANVSVRRVVPGERGGQATVVFQAHDAATSEELPADAVVVAAGAIESARLLLLSTSSRFPDGVGNATGRVGQGVTFHHVWWNNLVYGERLFAGRFGGYTGQSYQFANAATRGRHGSIKVVFSSRVESVHVREPGSAEETRLRLQARARVRPLLLAAESVPSQGKYVALSDRTDRFGDPFAHVHYESDPFDHATHAFASTINDRFVTATRAEPNPLSPNPDRYGSGAHHMGGCAMGDDPRASVVDRFGAVHGAPDVYVAGGSVFPGASGAMNPTLTMTALALRTAGHLLARLGR